HSRPAHVRSERPYQARDAGRGDGLRPVGPDRGQVLAEGPLTDPSGSAEESAPDAREADRLIGEELAGWGRVLLLETTGRVTGRPVRAAVGFVEGLDDT